MDAFSECSSRSGKDNGEELKQKCARLKQSERKCEKAVRDAFRYVNLGGCPFEIKALTMCEDDWCHQDPNSCIRECSGVREELFSCIEQHVSSFLLKNGLKNDETLT